MIAALGLGSNLGNPQENIETAISHLSKLGKIVARSHIYGSKPWGVTDQPDFCNAAILLELDLTPRQLLEEIKQIEQLMGRQKTLKWGPRLIDIDILSMGNLVINDPDLIIPHPHMHERVFVLVPLAEIDQNYGNQVESLSESELSQIWKL